LVAAISSLPISVGLWLVSAWRFAQGQRLLPAAPRPITSWTLVSLISVVLAYAFSAILFSRLAVWSGWLVPINGAPPTSSQLGLVMLIDGMAKLIALVFAVVWVSRRTRDVWAQFGWISASPLNMAQIAGIAVLMLLPPTMVLQAVLTQFWAYEHPIQDALLAESPAWVLFVAAISAVVLAPIGEELFFRSMVQGWLQTLADRPERPQPTTGSPIVAVASGGEDGPAKAPSESALLTNHQAWPSFERPGPSLLAADPQPDALSTNFDGGQLYVPRAWWPLFVSSAMFALAHMGQGPAPVSLFFLALGLGLLFRQTGRIWPSIAVHMALNAYSITMMLLALKAGVNVSAGSAG